MPALASVVAAAMRAERARLGWDQARLAQELGDGWSRARVSDLESGRSRVQVDDLAPLCRAFGITLSKLADRADEADRQALGLVPSS